MMHLVKQFVYSVLPHALTLEYQAWKIKRRDCNARASIKTAIETISGRWPGLQQANSVTDSPIFIFSAGWRSGSTLLQRLVMSDPRVLVWGESYAHCNPVRMHADSLRTFSSLYPKDCWFLSDIKAQNSENLTDVFIANMYPDMNYLRKAHQDFFLGLLAKPAIANGYARWGLKEVRLGIEDAIYLKWLFPNAKFLFLYRNPYKCYSSLRPYLRGWSLYENWPTTPVRSSRRFGQHWKNLVEGYLNRAHEVNALVIKYEALCNGEFPVSELESYLDITIDQRVLSRKLGQTPKKEPMTKRELSGLKKSVGSLAVELGYNH